MKYSNVFLSNQPGAGFSKVLYVFQRKRRTEGDSSCCLGGVMQTFSLLQLRESKLPVRRLNCTLQLISKGLSQLGV